MSTSYRLPAISVVAIMLLVPGIGIADGDKVAEQPDVQNESTIATPAPGGKGPGMGKQYQQNTPGPGKGSPEYRGGGDRTADTIEEEDKSEQATPLDGVENSQPEQCAERPANRGTGGSAYPRHKQYANPPLTPLDSKPGVKPAAPANAGPRRALLHAAAFGDLAGVASLLEAGASPNARSKDKRGRTALILAAQGGHVEVIRELVSRGARLEDRDKSGNTAFNWASMRGQKESARVLLDLGADVNTRNNTLVSPMLYAVGTRNKAMVRLIAEAKPDMDTETRDNKMTPLLLAIEHRDVEMTRLVIAAGANVNKRNADGFSPLMAAAEKSDPAITALLLNAGAEANVRDNKGRTALTLAQKVGNQAIVEALLAAGAES